jgi:hypothetical protein
MMFIKHTENYRMEDVPQSLFDAMGEFVGEAMKTGSIIDTAGLQPTAKGKRVRLSGASSSPLTDRSPKARKWSAATRWSKRNPSRKS